MRKKHEEQKEKVLRNNEFKRRIKFVRLIRVSVHCWVNLVVSIFSRRFKSHVPLLIWFIILPVFAYFIVWHHSREFSIEKVLIRGKQVKTFTETYPWLFLAESERATSSTLFYALMKLIIHFQEHFRIQQFRMWLDTFYINSGTRDRTCEEGNCRNYVKLLTA